MQTDAEHKKVITPRSLIKLTNKLFTSNFQLVHNPLPKRQSNSHNHTNQTQLMIRLKLNLPETTSRAKIEILDEALGSAE